MRPALLLFLCLALLPLGACLEISPADHEPLPAISFDLGALTPGCRQQTVTAPLMPTDGVTPPVWGTLAVPRGTPPGFSMTITTEGSSLPTAGNMTSLVFWTDYGDPALGGSFNTNPSVISTTALGPDVYYIGCAGPASSISLSTISTSFSGSGTCRITLNYCWPKEGYVNEPNPCPGNGLTARCLRFRMTETRDITTPQISEMKLYGPGGELLMSDTGFFATQTESNFFDAIGRGWAQGPAVAFDLSSGTNWLSVSQPAAMTITFPSLQSITGYKIYTAADIPERDPISYEMLVSSDCINYDLVHQVKGFTDFPVDRQVALPPVCLGPRVKAQPSGFGSKSIILSLNIQNGDPTRNVTYGAVSLKLPAGSTVKGLRPPAKGIGARPPRGALNTTVRFGSPRIIIPANGSVTRHYLVTPPRSFTRGAFNFTVESYQLPRAGSNKSETGFAKISFDPLSYWDGLF